MAHKMKIRRIFNENRKNTCGSLAADAFVGGGGDSRELWLVSAFARSFAAMESAFKACDFLSR
jgi:hypothetical protein